jgi:subtilisin-like proprotein convertase family protein
MKTNLKQWTTVLAAVVLGCGAARGQSSTNLTFNAGVAIPDADASGLALGQNLTLSTLVGPVNNVSVSLNISGGYNGDLYAYLAGPNGGFAVLLNRSGVTGANTFGYADTGFNVTLDGGAATSLQYYQTTGYPGSLNGSGQLTGTWQPSGLNLDPQSDPSLFPTTTPTALLSSFNGNNPNGTWTLFLSDVSAGGQATLVNWTLNIATAPEPGTIVLAALGGVAVLVLRQSRQRKL